MTNTTNNSKIEAIKVRVSELQKRLGVQLQVSIYKDTLNESDNLVKAAGDCRMSYLQTKWERGSKEDNPSYAVRVVAEGIGEIPYALMCEEIYVVGESVQGAD
jgi:hypothetical protein